MAAYDKIKPLSKWKIKQRIINNPMKALLNNKWKTGSLIILILVVGISLLDWVRIASYKTYPRQPEKSIQSDQDKIYAELVSGSTDIDWTRLDGTLAYIRGEYDMSDFRLVSLVRILYEFEDRIPEAYRQKILQVLLDFRYWWDEPGENSMCYWSENHQILFLTAEYLLGQKYPDQTFTNSGMTGLAHAQKAKTKILDWLEMRWNYGFTEFYSSVYYKEDIGALINLVDYAADKDVAVKAQMILDLLMYDVAAQSFGIAFTSVSGRAYTGYRKGGRGTSLSGITDYYWGSGKEIKPHLMYGMMVTKKYELPPVIKAIAKDTSVVVIKQSNGLDFSELKAEGYYGTDDRSMMMLWGMEGFSNPEIIQHSLSHIQNHNMFSNEFVHGMKVLDFQLIRWLNLAPTISRILNPQSNGAAIQRANTYTYKTPDYSIYSVQNHYPGDYASQHHVFGMNVKDHFSIFHTHPAVEKDAKVHSPNYWVGYGHLPHVAQNKNISLTIYNIPEQKSTLEMALLDYTHAWFPDEKFDEVYIEGSYAFGRKENTYCALIGHHDLTYRAESTDDLIQTGKRTFWIAEAGAKATDQSFERFIERIKHNELTFDSAALKLTYQSRDIRHELVYGKDFKIEGSRVDTEYDRFDSPYIKARRKDKTLTFRHHEHMLFLDFENLIRKYN